MKPIFLFKMHKVIFGSSILGSCIDLMAAAFSNFPILLQAKMNTQMACTPSGILCFCFFPTITYCCSIPLLFRKSGSPCLSKKKRNFPFYIPFPRVIKKPLLSWPTTKRMRGDFSILMGSGSLFRFQVYHLLILANSLSSNKDDMAAWLSSKTIN